MTTVSVNVEIDLEDVIRDEETHDLLNDMNSSGFRTREMLRWFVDSLSMGLFNELQPQDVEDLERVIADWKKRRGA